MTTGEATLPRHMKVLLACMQGGATLIEEFAMSWKTGFAGIVVAMALLAPSSAPAATQTFANPSVKGVRLDWCAHFGTDCGQAAADLFCRQNGFSSAQRFAMDPNIGRRGIATLVFGDGRLCNGPKCSGFRAITCAKADVATPAPVLKAIPRTPAIVAAPSAPPPKVVVPTVRPVPVLRPKITLKPTGPVAGKPSPGGKEMAGPGGLTIAHGAVANLTLTYPEGAWLYHCTSGCEFRLDTDIDMSGGGGSQTVGFTGDVKKIPHAGGFLWQVATAPFPPFGKGAPADFAPPHLVASGTFAGAAHDVPVDFKALANSGSGIGKARLHMPPPAVFYVRIVPVIAPGVKVFAGTPSNVIKVYYGQKPPPQPPLKLPSTSPPNLFNVKVVSFTPPDFADPNRWGCVVVTGYEPGTSSMIKGLYPLGEHCPPDYKGKGHNINSLGDLVDAAGSGITDLWDWVSGTYSDLKKIAVDIVMDYTPFGLQCKAMVSAVGGKGSDCRVVAEVGVNAGMAALGLPPSIPNYNQLIDQGVDAAVDLAADQITEQTGIPCVGPCQDALKKGLSAAADNLKKSNDTPGCVGTEEAHQNGREPLCLPSGVYAKPAHGAVDQPPLAMIAVTRTQYDRDPTSLYKEACYADLAIHFRNVFPAQKVSGPFHNTKDIPTTTIKGDLYNTAGLKLPETMPKGSTKVIPIVFQSAVKFEFGWTHDLWQQSEIPARELARTDGAGLVHPVLRQHGDGHTQCPLRTGGRIDPEPDAEALLRGNDGRR